MKKLNNIKKRIYKKIYKNNDEKFIKSMFKMNFGYKLDLDNPKTFNEKINWIKARYYNPLYEKCCDKLEVRDYVKEKGYENILNKIYKVYNSVDEINIDELPDKFVMKPSHSSGCVFIVKDKKTFNFENAFLKLDKKMKENLYNVSREWQYKHLTPKIIVEELIESDGDLSDYKFFCFNGKVGCIYVERNSTKPDFTLDFFDENWKHFDVRRAGHGNAKEKIPKPAKFEEMKKIAEKLSEDFAHVRVDLYCEKGKIYFGELTFTTGNGMGKFDPFEFDYTLGEKFNIDKLKDEIKNNKLK